MRRSTRFALVLLLLGVAPAPVFAGMGNPFPVAFESVYNIVTVEKLAEVPAARLRALSFFVVLVFASSWGVKGMWNSLQREFPKLPRLSYGKALSAVTLWGLLFIIVLTMISGARELMTPGAWHRTGFTYRLSDPPDSTLQSVPKRREGLEALRSALLETLTAEDRTYPEESEQSSIDENLWIVPGTSGQRYKYEGGGSPDRPNIVVAYEPESVGGSRFVLLASGQILLLEDFEFQLAMYGEHRYPGESPRRAKQAEVWP
ncbi:MAG: hypothetical protein AB7O26_18800 [Planctomycetaceae bacterium]